MLFATLLMMPDIMCWSVILPRPSIESGHGAVIDVEQLMLGPEGVAYPSADALPERSQKGALKTEVSFSPTYLSCRLCKPLCYWPLYDFNFSFMADNA